jgi:pullulanase/glycogen debranching enzyme
VRQDPILARVKLIAEPWDLGLGGYRVGGFPSGWSEWNDRFRARCAVIGPAKAISSASSGAA